MALPNRKKKLMEEHLIMTEACLNSKGTSYYLTEDKELKDEMLSDGVYPALPADMEYVEDFPTWAITYCIYDDSSGMSDEDKKIVDDWMEENGYSHIADVVENTRNEFNKYPAFGLACETETVVMAKQPKKKEESND